MRSSMSLRMSIKPRHHSHLPECLCGNSTALRGMVCLGLVCVWLATTAGLLAAQEEPSQVVIKREAVRLISPDQFQIPLSLSAEKKVRIQSRVEGVVQNVRVQPGGKVSNQEELLKIESAAAAKKLELARASLKLATMRRDRVKSEVQEGIKPASDLELAEAEVAVAQAQLELAQMNLEQTSVRAPFAGQVIRLPISQGSNVAVGDTLVELRDSSRLVTQLPVDRTKTKVGDSITLKLDQGTANGKVQVLLPLDETWQGLRELIPTAALAEVVVDNGTSALEDGQTVFSTLVPRQPILEVSNTSLKNSEDGDRVVQVLREGMIRDIQVSLLGPVGEGRSYVSGPVQEKDELITETSFPLRDGTMVRPISLEPPESKPQRPGTPGSTPQPDKPPVRTPGF